MTFKYFFYAIQFQYILLFQIPVILNAVGGILVGLLTTYAGGVRKVSSNPIKENHLIQRW